METTGAPVARPLLGIDTAVFDLDGVITLTARLHRNAWKALFDDFLASRADGEGEDHRPFDEGDYLAHVDGLPRQEGVQAFLASRGVRVDEDQARELGERKNRLFHELMERDGVEVDEGAVRFVRDLKASGLRVGLASSSKNVSAILHRAGLTELFDAQVDGRTREEIGLRGKPHPDIFLECARRLGTDDPARTLVVEDAASGVQAARRGRFGLVLAIDRGGNWLRLREAGAHLIVHDLGTLSAKRVWRLLEDWVLAYDGLERDDVGLREALCTLGNGRFGTRGAAEEQRANGIDYPGTYIAGGYNRLSSEVAGRTVENEDLVNFPNWLPLTFRPVGGAWLDLWRMEVLEYRQELDMREAVLHRKVRVRDQEGRITGLHSRRIVHMDDPHVAAIQWHLVPENWSGEIELRSGLDGSVRNDGVARYRQLASKHLEVAERGPVAPEGIHLLARTCESRIEVAQAARTRVFRGAREELVERRIVLDHPEEVHEDIRTQVHQGRMLRVEKVVGLVTSRDRGIGECGYAARRVIQEAPDFSTLRSSHAAAWARLWRRCDVELEPAVHERHPGKDQLVMRLHIFHLLQTASPHVVDMDVGIPARGLHGEAYRGHIFWDEVFILPFFVQRLPDVARASILYRYRRLDEARRIALSSGQVGAAFPWQSASDGRETTQEMHLNPRSGQWGPDHSHLQRHVNAAIVYTTWKYLEATDDRVFLESYAAELILEVARYWSSLAEYDDRTARYHIRGVMGPDEYHEKYPGAERGGLDDNAYTNLTAVWCLERAREVLRWLPRERRWELMDKLELNDAELERWKELTRWMTLHFHDGVLSQFAGYEVLEEFDWEGYARKYGNIERLDRILEAEGDTPDRYKVSKQADVSMLLYLFTHEELLELIHGLGYDFDEEDIRRTVQYYQTRTSHGSTLSRVAYTSAVHREDCEAGGRLFLAALESDLLDIQGGTTREGVHLGAMAGTVDIVTRYYAGLDLEGDEVRFRPHPPARIHRMAFRFRFRGRWYAAELHRDRLRLAVDGAKTDPAWVSVQGRRYPIDPGRSIEVAVHPPDEPHHPLPHPPGTRAFPEA